MQATPLAEKTAVVTGAASGIGRKLALAMSEGGARVLAVDRDRQGLDETCSMVGGARIAPLVLDVLEDEAGERIVEGAVEAFGGIDVLVNCAGVFPSTPALELDAGEWDLVLDLNLRAPFLLSQAVARHMVATERGGNIVNMASAAGTVARPGVAHYCASKAGLIMLTKALAIEWAEHDIRVNAVAPGLIETPGVEDLLATEEGRQEHQQKIAKIPMARTGRPGEVAETVLFLASDSASFVTGHTLFVDGGYSAGHTFRG
ncbi:MAG: SDR family oxidoreductase [Actinomycetota bacterium]|nr:SDR family oxidoreductase [Actinomycetota bacterium]